MSMKAMTKYLRKKDRVNRMKKRETIDERLNRLNREFDEILENAGTDNSEYHANETTPKQLMKSFGLTAKEAKAWLKREPSFPADEFSHEQQNRRRLHRTWEKQTLLVR
jgi:glycyl-tRNA synthetase alpha subunit